MIIQTLSFIVLVWLQKQQGLNVIGAADYFRVAAMPPHLLGSLLGDSGCKNFAFIALTLLWIFCVDLICPIQNIFLKLLSFEFFAIFTLPVIVRSLAGLRGPYYLPFTVIYSIAYIITLSQYFGTDQLTRLYIQFVAYIIVTISSYFQLLAGTDPRIHQIRFQESQQYPWRKEEVMYLGKHQGSHLILSRRPNIKVYDLFTGKKVFQMPQVPVDPRKRAIICLFKDESRKVLIYIESEEFNNFSLRVVSLNGFKQIYQKDFQEGPWFYSQDIVYDQQTMAILYLKSDSQQNQQEGGDDEQRGQAHTDNEHLNNPIGLADQDVRRRFQAENNNLNMNHRSRNQNGQVLENQEGLCLCGLKLNEHLSLRRMRILGTNSDDKAKICIHKELINNQFQYYNQNQLLFKSHFSPYCDRLQLFTVQFNNAPENHKNNNNMSDVFQNHSLINSHSHLNNSDQQIDSACFDAWEFRCEEIQEFFLVKESVVVSTFLNIYLLDSKSLALQRKVSCFHLFSIATFLSNDLFILNKNEEYYLCSIDPKQFDVVVKASFTVPGGSRHLHIAQIDNSNSIMIATKKMIVNIIYF